MIRRDFKIRYLGSMLGSYWNFIHPVAMITIYTIIFSKVLKAKLGPEFADDPYSYTLFICAGILPWTAFTELVSRSTSVFFDNANLVKKVNFPKEILLTITSGSATVNLGISMLIYAFLLIATGHGLSIHFMELPLIILLQSFFACSLGLVLGVLNVFFRDIQQMLPIVFQIWFWITPIIYTAQRVPEQFKGILLINPLYYFVSTYQHIMFLKSSAPLDHYVSIILGSTALFLLGSTLYYKLSDQISDEI